MCPTACSSLSLIESFEGNYSSAFIVRWLSADTDKLPFGLGCKALAKRFRPRERLSRFCPCVAMGRITILRIPTDLYFSISKHFRWKANYRRESSSCPFFRGPLQTFQHLFRTERKSAVCIAGPAECACGNSPPSIGGGLDPLLGDPPQHNIFVVNLLVVVGFHAPGRIPRRVVHRCTAHLLAQLSEKGSDQLDVE